MLGSLISLLLIASISAQDHVKVTLYYESLCPYCRAFMTGSLYNAWTTPGIQGIFDLDLIPYGNAKEVQQGGNWTFTCQHGTLECLGNLIETCLVVLYPNTTTHYPVIECAEANTTFSSDPKSALQTCFAKFQLDYSKVDACANGPDGNNYQHQMALRTEDLNPAHQFVPWILINGSHDYQDQAESDLLSVICQVYTGPLPSACN